MLVRCSSMVSRGNGITSFFVFIVIFSYPLFCSPTLFTRQCFVLFFQDTLVAVFENGKLLRDYTLDEVRKRAEIALVKEDDGSLWVTHMAPFLVSSSEDLFESLQESKDSLCHFSLLSVKLAMFVSFVTIIPLSAQKLSLHKCLLLDYYFFSDTSCSKHGANAFFYPINHD